MWAQFPLRGWALRSEAFSGFRVQLYTPEIPNRKVKPVPTCSEEQGLRGKDSVILAGGKALAARRTRTSTAPKQMVWLAEGKDGEDLALLQHFSLGNLETLPKAEKAARNHNQLGIRFSPDSQVPWAPQPGSPPRHPGQ